MAAKGRKGPQRVTKSRKGPQMAAKDRKEPQRAAKSRKGPQRAPRATRGCPVIAYKGHYFFPSDLNKDMFYKTIFWLNVGSTFFAKTICIPCKFFSSRFFCARVLGQLSFAPKFFLKKEPFGLFCLAHER